MIGLIIKTLNTIPILSERNMEEYRQYLTINYPQMLPVDRERVLAQLVDQTLASYIMQFSNDYQQPLKAILYQNVSGIQPFAVYASDLFKAGLQLAYQRPEFYEEIAHWIGQFDFAPVHTEAVVNYIKKQNNRVSQSVRLAATCSFPAVNPVQIQPERPEHREAPVVVMPEPVPAKPSEAAPARPKQDEPAFKALNPYLTPAQPEATSALPAVSGDYYEQIIARFETVEQSLKVSLHKLVQNKKSTIPIALAVVTLVSCFWFFNYRTRAKETPATAQAPLNAAQTVKPDAKMTDNAPVMAASQKAADEGASPPGRNYNRPSPIPAAPNTIVVGFVKMKTANGMEDVPVRRYFERKLRIKASAYDLSVASCGKDMTHPGYGITRTGTRAKRGRTIAVDPKIIPLGRKVYICFPPKYQHMNGIYVAEDTGKKIKGYRIDVFFGEDRDGEKTVRREARKFGHRKVEVYLLQDQVVP